MKFKHTEVEISWPSVPNSDLEALQIAHSCRILKRIEESCTSISIKYPLLFRVSQQFPSKMIVANDSEPGLPS